MFNAVYIMAMINPLYWLGELLIRVQNFGDPASLHTLNVIMTPVVWSMICYFLAESRSQSGGRFLAWYAWFFLFNLWAVAITWGLDEARRRKLAGVAQARKLVNPPPSVSDLVGGAVSVLSPGDLAEPFVQQLVDKGLFDDAVGIAQRRIERWTSEGDSQKADDYKCLIRWIENQRRRKLEEAAQDSD